MILQPTARGSFHAQTVRPPSTPKLIPVTNDPSSDAKYKAAFATSIGSVRRPRGTFATNCSRFSGVSFTPTNDSKRPVPERSGAIALTRILSGPYSAARPLVAYRTGDLAARHVFLLIWQ